MFSSTLTNSADTTDRIRTVRRSFIILFLVSIFFSAFMFSIYYNFIRNAVYQEVTNTIDLVLKERSDLITRQLDEWQHDVRFLRSTPPTAGLIRAYENGGIDPIDGTFYETWLDRLTIIFNAYIESNPTIMQVRLINVVNGGMEEIRVQRKNGLISIIPESGLQNKSNEPYFQDILDLKRDENYISNITLNREFGQVEYPYVKTLRIIEPIFNSDFEIFAIVVVNYYASTVLSALRQDYNNIYQTYLIDSEDNFILGPSGDLEFGQQLNNNNRWSTFFQDIETDIKDIQVAKSSLFKENVYYNQNIISLSRQDDGRALILKSIIRQSVITQLIVKRTSFVFIAIITAVVLIIGILWFAFTLIKRKNALIDQQSEFEAIVKGSVDAIVSMNPLGHIRNWNPAAEKLFGFSEHYAIGRSIFDLVVMNEQDSTELKRNFDIIAHGGIAKKIEIKVRQHNGHAIAVSITLSSIFSTSGQFIGIASILRDVTEKNKIQGQLEAMNDSLENLVAIRTEELEKVRDRAIEASKAKSEFVANISHELRTPMNAILGLTQLMLKRSLMLTEKNMIKKIDKAGRTLLSIINDILDFSKIEANKIELENEPFLLAEVVDNLASIMASSVGSKPIEVNVSPIPEPAKYLKGDALRLNQVLMNLASNAIKFTAQGDIMIRISLLAVDENKKQVTLRFSVKDTGIGISADKQKSIFSAFSQADATTTRIHGGTGLGLTISRNLVERMGSKLQLTSSPGVGSEFFFDVCFEQSPPLQGSINAMMHQHLLVAEPNPTTRALLVEIVESLGWSATIAKDSKHFEDCFSDKAADRFDVVLINSQFDGLKGMMTLHKLADDAQLQEVIIILTANPHQQEALGNLKGNAIADHLLVKPITASILYDAVIGAKENHGFLAQHRLDQPDRSMRLLGKKILVVDDSETNRDVAEAVLVDEGAQVFLAENGQVALERLRQNDQKMDLVLLDIQMPVMDGYETIKAIRTSPSMQKIPVIALSAGAYETNRVAALEAGMNGFIAKPFDVEALIALVEVMIKTPERTLAPAATPEPTAEKDNTATEHYLDIKDALSKWKSAERYQKQLTLFLAETKPLFDSLSPSIRESDTYALKSLLHKLRGSAGSLSLFPLMREAEALELRLNDLKGSADTSSLSAAFVNTEHEIEQYLTLNRAPKEKKINYAIAKATDATDITTLYHHFLSALDTDDVAEVEQTMQRVRPFLPASLAQKIESSVEKFDFYRAEETLKHFIEAQS